MNFLNDNDPFCAEWIRNLITAGHIASGVVDERSIKNIKAADLVGYRQCHFFCGVAGWPQAFRLAGIEHIGGIWSASLPCQPFSVAGKRGGSKDDRHLWPVFRDLVEECRPAAIIGEQVASKDGREWFAGVRAELEALEYVVGGADICSPCVGAPHIRQRLFWGAARLADLDRNRCAEHVGEPRERSAQEDHTAEREGTDRVADSQDSDGRSGERGTEIGQRTSSGRWIRPAGRGADSRLGNPTGFDELRDVKRGAGSGNVETGGSGSDGRLGHSFSAGLEGHTGDVAARTEPGRVGSPETGSIATSGPWSDSVAIWCLDGKYRRVGSRVQPLAAGIPRAVGPLFAGMGPMGRDPKADRKTGRIAKQNRIGRLKGYGNSIVPELAAEFIVAFLGSLDDLGSMS